MLQGITPRSLSSSLYEAIPHFSKSDGAQTLFFLTVEGYLLSSAKNSFGIGPALASTKVYSIIRTLCADSSDATLLASLVAVASTFYYHNVKIAPNSYKHKIARAIELPFNVMAKIISSFALGKMTHEAFYRGQKPGALMAAITLSVLGFSASNVVLDWRFSPKLQRLF
jgi:hypothetical protein